MKPVDKFGNRIHPTVFETLTTYGEHLSRLGYTESRSKPNLFYYSPTGGISFFMDMRGTSVVDISEDTRPLFYWDIDLDMADWAKRRLLKQERERLAEHGVPLRLSGARHFATFRETSSGDDEYLSDPFGAADGYCESCGTDFSGTGYYCSVECEREERPRRFCSACEDRVDFGDKIRHHVSYFPEETVIVCRACHNKIHFSDQYPELTPPEEEIRRFYDEGHDETTSQPVASDSEANTESQYTASTDENRGWKEIFPFTPRPAQEDGIETALPVLEDDGYLILEGACGTGKTLLSLTAAIEQILNGDKKRLVVITPLKQQQQQFVDDLRAINETLPEHEMLNGLTLIGKKEVCPYSREELVGFTPNNVQGRCSDLREETRDAFDEDRPIAMAANDIVENAYVGAETPDPDPTHWPGVETAGSWSRFPKEELPEIEDSTICPFYAQHYAYEKRPPITFASAPNHVFGGEDIVQTAVDEDYCPHSAMYALIDGAHVLVANYTHLFNHGVRGLLDDFIDEDTLLIVDEAHKLEARVRTNLDREKAFSTLQQAADDFHELLSRPEIQACNAEDSVGADLTKRDLERAQTGLTRFIDQANEAISTHLHSEYGEWSTALAEFITDSDDHHDYFEDPDALRREVGLPGDEEFPLQSLSTTTFGEPDDISKAIAAATNPDEDSSSPLSALAQVAAAMDTAITTHKHRLESGDEGTLPDPYDTATSNVATDNDILSTPLGTAAIHRYNQWVDEDSHYTDNPELSTLDRFVEGWDELDTVSHVRLAQIEWNWTLQDRSAVEAWNTDAVEAWQAAFRARLSIMNCVPQTRIKDELSEFGGGIIMSATLDPMTVFREVTGFDDLVDDRPVVEARYNDPGYPEENRATFLVDADWFTSDNRGDPTQESSLMTGTRQQYASIIEAVARTHGNILLVMPSYDEAAWATTHLEQSSLVTKKILLDQSSTNKRTEELKQSFFTGPHKILVTSSHGTLIEGVDYEGDKLHTVLVCGLPIRGGLRAQAVKHAYNHTFDGSGFEYAMLVPAVRRTRQALGRVIRSSTDVGTRILVDGRYANSHTATAHSYLSPNEQSEATVISPRQLYESLSMFWQQHSD